ncbi:MAG: MBOAT family protein [Lachnospiraceae bacterium]|nr:MBOAT family protein [Lachnospiraceae bacterium]
MQATFTSFYFLCFYAGVLIIYYLIPKKLQWAFLLTASTAYYLLTGNGILILYPVGACLAAYGGIRLMTWAEKPAIRRWILVAVAGLLLGGLCLLKYADSGLLAPLGVSFYTLTVLGYVIDVYHGIAEPQKNFLKLALYGLYFPAILSGPVLRYREDGEQFFQPHPFDYRQVTMGLQRMVWGLFKTLVISERMNLVVNTVYGDWRSYPGIYIWLATACFAFQLYTNFSGCMDIALGMSQTFGLKLPENFRTPFFSKTIAEYWRRWHITLGVWMKEYVFYPLLRTGVFARLGKELKKKAGKKRGKQLTTFAAMLALWFTVGLWHGGDWKYIIGSGLLHWAYITAGELLAPFFKKGMERLGIAYSSRPVEVCRMLRTFLLVNIGFVFFRADSVGAAAGMLKQAVGVWNPHVLLDGSVFTLGLDVIESVIALVSLLILLAVSLLQQRGSVREMIERQRLPLRFIIWYALLFYTILLGYYGPGYSAVEFIYQGF